MRRQLDWRLIALCLSRTGSGLVFTTFAASLPVLRVEWNLSAAMSGSIAGGFSLGYALSLVIFSCLADFFGPRRIFLGSLTAGAVLSLAFAALARGYLSAIVLYSLLGFSLGGSYTTGLMLLARLYPQKRWGANMGLFIAATSLGYGLSLAVSGVVLPIGGYRLAFWLTCLGPALGAVSAWLALKGVRLPAPERRPRAAGLWRRVLANRPARWLIAGYTLHNWELLGMWAWTPAFVAASLSMGGTGATSAVSQGALAGALFHFTGLSSSWLVGALSDRWGRARVMIYMAAPSALCAFVIGWTLGGPWWLVLGLGLAFAFLALGDSPVLSAALSREVGEEGLGTAFGLRSLLGFGAGAVSPFAFGLCLDLLGGNGSPLAWGVAYGVLGLGGVGAWFCARRYDTLTRSRAQAGGGGGGGGGA